MLIVISGLPGTGKTALAEALSTALPAFTVSVGGIESALRRAGIGRREPVRLGSYSVAATLVDDHLRLGHHTIADAVNAGRSERDLWQALAHGHDLRPRLIETICSDLVLHRRRVEGRQHASPGSYPPTWTDVQQCRREYQRWESEHLVIDSAAGFEDNVRTALRYVNA
jgi:predicted kinase